MYTGNVTDYIVDVAPYTGNGVDCIADIVRYIPFEPEGLPFTCSEMP